MRFLRNFVACVIVTLFLVSQLSAQTNTNKCGWSIAQKNLEAKNPSLYELQRKKAQQRIDEYLQNHRIQPDDAVYTLPVVVHVINIGGAIGAQDNPTDASINDMITELNNAWRMNGAQFGGADIRIQFQLASRSPQCGTTNGIVRMNGSGVTNYVSGGIAIGTAAGCADEVAVKNLSRWPNTDYINIWIVHKILGSSTGTGGFAYFAEYNSAATDGITINSNYVGFNPTIVHEMGHVFELFHTFHDEDGYEDSCPRTDSCEFYGDEVCDTEGGLVEYNCSNTTNSCTGQPYVIADIPHSYTVLNNYMNYTNCPYMFTQGQKDRIRATLFTFRPGLISSGALSTPPSLFPTAACVPTADNGQSVFYGIEMVEFNTISVYSNSSAADNAIYIDRSCNQRTTVIRGQTYPLTITGSYLNPCWFRAYIDYNNDGDFDDAGESLISSGIEFDGTITVDITIPSTGITPGIPLRLRVISDYPWHNAPTACHLDGDATDGSGQVEDYAIIIARQIVSANSGPWNVASTWTCNCLPQPDDEVVIKTGHTITLTPIMGEIKCIKLNLEAGSNFNLTGAFKTTGH